MVKSKSNNPFNKVRRCSNNNCIDRISNLPEELLSQILSLLLIEFAVRTSALSTRWKFLWTTITNFYCTCPHCRKGRHASKLASTIPKLYVNRLLQLLNPSSIKIFRLKSCKYCFDPSYLNSLVSAGFGGSFQEFELYFMSNEFMELPLCQISCNLVVLELRDRIRFNVPTSASICFPSLQSLHLFEVSLLIPSNSSISFPKLKIMDLSHVKFANENSLQELFSNCPILDELILRKDCDQIKSLNICIPSITRLSIELSTYCIDSISISRVVQINCPALQNLNIHDQVPCIYLPAKNSSSLLQANVRMLFYRKSHVNEENCTSITKFIGSLTNVKLLSVSGHVLKAFRIASANIVSGFHNLTHLEVEVSDCIDFSALINKILGNIDNLEHIVMKGSLEGSSNCSSQSWWTEPLNAPKCLLSRVTFVSFSYMIVDCCDQLELLRYVLKNAGVLQMLTIGTSHISKKKQHELSKKISFMPRVSKTCQVAYVNLFGARL